jgi:glycosyltransferase involved in cell wall biosynthesis
VRILTFNHHESYIASLAKTGHQFDVVIRRGRLDLSWNPRARRVPDNITLVEFNNTTKRNLKSGHYDVVICHTIKNLLWIWLFFKPRFIFVAHIPLFQDSFPQKFKSFLKKLIWHLFRRTHSADFFAVSQFKLHSWGEIGYCAVLAPGAFPPLKKTEKPSDILIVCNNLKERGDELGLDMINRLVAKAPIYSVGHNPGITYNIQPKDFHDFQEIITGFSIYLYTIKMPWGDGYNTAMLEAMRMGMAIVTVENSSSPIVHGVNGLIGRSEAEILEHLLFLRSNPQAAQKLGEGAIKTIDSEFSEKNFVENWQRVLSLKSLNN